MTGVKARGVGKSRWSRMAAVLQEEKMGKKKDGDGSRRWLMRGRVGACDGQGSGRGFRRAEEV